MGKSIIIATNIRAIRFFIPRGMLTHMAAFYLPYFSVLEMFKKNLPRHYTMLSYMKGENKGLVDAEKGIYKYNELVILKEASMPAVLIECGIIVNRDEELELDTKECQKTIITSITETIIKYKEFKDKK